MKKIGIYIIFTFYCLICYGLPAKPGVIRAQQPDGTMVNIRMEGNNCHKRIFSEDGYILTTDSLGFYVYADTNAKGEIIPSSVKATDADKRDAVTLEKLSRLHQTGLTESYILKEPEDNLSEFTRGIGLGDTKFPSIGEQRSVVILVEFADLGFTFENPNDYYTRMLNEPGFSDVGATGSARDYFVSNSNGIFVPQFDVYGPVILQQPYAYYGRNDPWGLDENPWGMVIEACELLDDEIDFSLYDRDDDGIIDNVYVFYAGFGEADGGGPNTVWPHSYDITSVTLEPIVFDGVRLDHYACSNELQKNLYEYPDGIGTFCHEFSHVLGLPDLYSTTYTRSFTPNTWDILDIGSYNNYSRTPPNYSAYERYALDWIDPQILSEGEKILNPIVDSNEAFLVLTDKDTEYFLFENRQQYGFDEFIPGHGMLIWHIDFNLKKWRNNTVNNNSAHQNVDLIEADYRKNDYTLDGDSFPGASNVTEFSYETTPAFVNWDREKMPLRIYDIAESYDGVISFSVEEIKTSDIRQISDDSDLISIEGNTVKSGNVPVEIFKLNGTKIAFLKNSSIVLESGIYIAVSIDRSLKFIIP